MLVTDEQCDKQRQSAAQQTIAELQTHLISSPNSSPSSPSSTTSVTPAPTIVLGDRMLPIGHNNTRCTVVVVEDHPEMNQFIVNSLSRDFDVHSAKNGKEGLELS